MTVTKPMLACREIPKAEDINYPVLVSPKLDGMRCLIKDGKAVSRTFKPIPNHYVREWCEANLPEGFDGELMMRDLTGKFNECSGNMRRKEGTPDFVFAAFDWVQDGEIDRTFSERYAALSENLHDGTFEHVSLVPHKFVNSAEELLAVYEDFLQIGYEGLMVRDPGGAYKCGRATLKSGLLLKFKPFEDEEALVIGVTELLHNANVAKKDAFGRTKRASHRKNKTRAETMGSLQCKFEDGTEFSLGTGFSAMERQEIWDSWSLATGDVIGLHVKVKFQPPRKEGEAPRFPSFLGFRDMELDS